MAFNRICTSVYRIYVICMAFGRMLCGKLIICWGFTPNPLSGDAPGRTVKFGCNTIEQLSEIPFSLKVFGKGRGNPLCKKGVSPVSVPSYSVAPRAAPPEGDGFFRRAFAVFAPSAMYNIRKRPRAPSPREKRKDVPEMSKSTSSKPNPWSLSYRLRCPRRPPILPCAGSKALRYPLSARTHHSRA